MSVLLFIFVGTFALTDFMRAWDSYDWQRIEHDLWLREMRDKYPWPRFQL